MRYFRDSLHASTQERASYYCAVLTLSLAAASVLFSFTA